LNSPKAEIKKNYLKKAKKAITGLMKREETIESN
jgi:hypothetical protein